MHYISNKEIYTALKNNRLMQFAAVVGVMLAGVMSSFFAFSKAEEDFGYAVAGHCYEHPCYSEVHEMEPAIYYVEYSETNAERFYGYNNIQRYRLPEE